MQLEPFVAVALLTPGSRTVQTVLRFGCSQIVVERLDRLVNPEEIPSPHVHQVTGGSAFAASIPGSDVAQITNCTICSFSEDISNYWTANLYFKARDGTYKRVPQIPNRGNTGEVGGMTVYYTTPYDGKRSVTAFKPGFRMLAGNQSQRTTGGITRWNAICFRYYNAPNFEGDNSAPCSDSSVDFLSLPAKACPGGIRNITRFPAPSFNDKSPWPAGGSQPFVLPQIGNIGDSQHGDYVFGWKGDVLKKAMEAGCLGATCTPLKMQAYADANKCAVPDTGPEHVDGYEF